MEALAELPPVRDLLASRYLQALLILAVALVLSRFAHWFLTRALAALARRTETDLDDQILALLHIPIRQSVLLLGLGLATVRLSLPPRFELVVLGVIKTLAILIWLICGIRFGSLLFSALTERQDRYSFVDTRTLPLFNNLARVVLVALAIYFIFLSWSIDVTAWLASAGIIGIAVGFAAKDTLANLFAGVFISADAPYKVGDFITLDSGERGRVTHIGIRSTRLLTRDDIEITLPNAVIANAKIVNESGGPWEKERVRVPVSVAYGSDVDQVREILLAIAGDQEHVCPEPAPRVRFRSFGDSGLSFELLAWIDEPVLRGRVLDSLNMTIYKRFLAEKIEIPYPKRDLYVREMPQ